MFVKQEVRPEQFLMPARMGWLVSGSTFQPENLLGRTSFVVVEVVVVVQVEPDASRRLGGLAGARRVAPRARFGSWRGLAVVRFTTRRFLRFRHIAFAAMTARGTRCVALRSTRHNCFQSSRIAYDSCVLGRDSVLFGDADLDDESPTCCLPTGRNNCQRVMVCGIAFTPANTVSGVSSLSNVYDAECLCLAAWVPQFTTLKRQGTRRSL